MATSKKPSPFGVNPHVMCALTPGTLGINDAGSPDTPDWFFGDTPSSLGCNDHADPKFINQVHLVSKHLRLGPALAPAPNLSNVPQADLREYVPHLNVALKDNVRWAGEKAGINPGLLAAILLTELDDPRFYTCAVGTVLHGPDCVRVCPPNAPGVCSFDIGTDDYKSDRRSIEAAVSCATEVRFANVHGGTSINESGNPKDNIHFASGKDAVLGVAVYLKFKELKVRKVLASFEAQPLAVQWGLARLAMNAGERKPVTVHAIEHVRQGRDIFPKNLSIRHGKMVRGGGATPLVSMLRVVAIGMYLSERVFGMPM